MTSGCLRRLVIEAFRSLLIVLCLHLGALLSYSQGTGIGFRVLNAGDEKPLSGAMMTVYGRDSLSLGYGISDDSGILKPDIRWADAYFAVLRMMGYQTLNLPVSALTNGAVFRMTETAVNLPPVTVFRPPVKWTGDTLVYDAGAFLKPGDLVLKDILSRMPGLTVSKNGVVSYQGEPIKRFYIEGLDLLGSRYNEATNNLSADAVSSVEILERHQDVRILKGKIPEKKASLNVRIKEKYKTRPFGYAVAGLSHNTENYEGQLNVTHVGGKSIQYFLNAKGNNAGTFYEEETRRLQTGDLTMISIPPPVLFVTSNSGLLPLPDSYYMSGSGLTASGNALIKTGDDSTLRINADLLSEKSKTENFSEERYYVADTSLLLRELSKKSRPVRMGRLSLTYEKNSDRVFLKDEGDFEMSGSGLFTNLYEGETFGSSLLLKSAETRFTRMMGRNSLTGYLPIGSHILNFSSLLRFTGDKGRVILSEIPEPWTMIRRTEGNHKASSVIRLNERLVAEPSLSYGFADVSSGFSDDVLGNAHTAIHRIAFSPELRIMLLDERLSLQINPEINYSFSFISDDLKSISRKASSPGFSPEADLTYRFSPHHSVSFGASFASEYDSEGIYLPSRVKLSHRLYRSFYPDQFKTSSQEYSFRWKYNNLFHYFFANIYAIARIKKHFTATETRVTEDATELTEIYFPHQTVKYNVRFEADKSFPKEGWDIKWSTEYGQTEVPLLLNGSDGRTILQNIETDASVEYSPLESFQLKTYAIYRFMNARSTEHSSSVSAEDHQLSLGCSLVWSPVPDLTGSVKYEALTFPRGASSGTESLHIMEAELAYVFLEKHRVQLQAMNVLGQKDYVIRSFSPSFEQISRSMLAPFRVMISYRLRF